MEREVIAMPDKDRVIYLIDMDAYFASIEELYHPELKKIPMAICGDPASRRGIILAKNQLAKGYGVKTAEPLLCEASHKRGYAIKSIMKRRTK